MSRSGNPSVLNSAATPNTGVRDQGRRYSSQLGAPDYRLYATPMEVTGYASQI